MATKANPLSARITKLTREIEAIETGKADLWERLGFYIQDNPQSQNVAKYKKQADKLYGDIHYADERLEGLYAALWDLYYDAPLIEQLDGKITDRIVYCDGSFHFITDDDDNFKYGLLCECE